MFLGASRGPTIRRCTSCEATYTREAALEDGRLVHGEHRLLERVPRERWRMRRAVRVREPGGVERTVVDEYTPHMRPIEIVVEHARCAGYEPALIRCADTGALLAPGQPFVGEALFVLHVPGGSPPCS